MAEMQVHNCGLINVVGPGQFIFVNKASSMHSNVIGGVGVIQKCWVSC